MTPLRQRMLEDMRVRNLSPNTQRAYLESVARFARHFGRSPGALGPDDIRTYQVYLIDERQLAPSSLGIAVCALRFLYKVTLKQPWSFDELIPAPKKPRRLPVVLSPDEVVQFLAAVPDGKHRAILTTCYATGLRVSEVVRLRPRDIDSHRMVIRVEQGKGQRDRYVMLSPILLALLRDWWRVHRPTAWLFPGEPRDQPITSHAVREACQRAHRRSRRLPHRSRCRAGSRQQLATLRFTRSVEFRARVTAPTREEFEDLSADLDIFYRFSRET